MKVFLKRHGSSLLDLITLVVLGVTWELVSVMGGNYALAFIARIARLAAR